MKSVYFTVMLWQVLTVFIEASVLPPTLLDHHLTRSPGLTPRGLGLPAQRGLARPGPRSPRLASSPSSPGCRGTRPRPAGRGLRAPRSCQDSLTTASLLPSTPATSHWEWQLTPRELIPMFVTRIEDRIELFSVL